MDTYSIKGNMPVFWSKLKWDISYLKFDEADSLTHPYLTRYKVVIFIIDF